MVSRMHYLISNSQELGVPWSDDWEGECEGASELGWDGSPSTINQGPLPFIVAAIALFVLLSISTTLVLLCYKRWVERRS